MIRRLLPMLLLVGCATTAPPRTQELQVPDATCPTLSEDTAKEFVALSLECVDREYPNKPSNTMSDASHVQAPREMTPAFFGCYDWHSAVHGHWAMVRIAKLHPDLPEVAAIKEKLAAHITKDAIQKEVEHFEKEHQTTFERPYGWGWLLRLSAELHTWGDPLARELHSTLEPLTALLAARTAAYLEKLSVPVRVGTHNNTAFALVHMHDFAKATANAALEAQIEERARAFYLQDKNCPLAYEPSGEDFISPCFAEADIMRRVLPSPDFQRWYRNFMPATTTNEFRSLLRPLEIRDLKDPKIGHLIGLAFQRAWSMDGIAQVLADPAGAATLRKLARNNCEQAYTQMFKSGYGGSHWLASFAIYHLSNVGR